MSTNSGIVQLLKTGTLYNFQVRAVSKAAVYGEYSDVVQITTATESLPAGPSGITLAGIVTKNKAGKFRTTLELSWTAPVGVVVSKYEIQWCQGDHTSYTILHTSTPAGKATSAKWSLSAGPDTYTCFIRAHTKGEASSAWSTYIEHTTTFTNDLPTPTGLALKENGKKLTASVNKVDHTIYPQIHAYRYYASKQTGFTPGSTNLVGESASNKLTFQEAYDSGTGTINEIAIGDTIFVRVSVIDAVGNETAKCAEVSLVMGGAAPDAPTGLTLTPAVVLVSGKKYDIKLGLSWTSPTNVTLKSFELEIYDAANGGGTLQKTLSPGKNATVASWTDNKPDTYYSARIRGVSHWGRTGAWSAWANCDPASDAVAPPVPTTLSLKQDSKKITARWDTISHVAYPDFKGFRIYASKVNGFTPAAGNMVYEGRGTSKTFQEAANAGGSLEEIAIGDVIYVRVSSYDEKNNESNKCTQVYITAGGDAPNAPTGLSLTLTPHVIKGKVYQISALAGWTLPTNVELSSLVLEFWSGANGSGAVEKKFTLAKTATSHAWTDNSPDQAYSFRIYAVSKWHREGSWSAWGNVSAAGDTTPPAIPASATCRAQSGGFHLQWAKVSDIDLDEYQIKIYSGGSYYIIARAGAGTTVKTLKFGLVSETGGITLTKGTTYAFYIFTSDKAGNVSISGTSAGSVSAKTGVVRGATNLAENEDDGSYPDIAPTSKVAQTQAQILVPSSYYLDLRLDIGDGSGHQRVITADWLTLHDNSSPWKTIGIANVNVTNVITAAGPVADGRDQAAAFASQWIYFHVIGKSSDGTKKSISSLSPTAPTLPSGYDYYDYVGSAYVNSAGLILTDRQRNNMIWQFASGINGTPTNPNTWQTLTIPTCIPPTAKEVFGKFGLLLTSYLTTCVEMEVGTDNLRTHHYVRGNFPPVASV